jgi:hypothetical protein
LKSFFSILLASLFLLQSAEKFIIVVNYELNKASITTNFCENKAKPMLHCNGKCHLKKQLQQQDKKENSPTNSLKEKLEIQFLTENKKQTFICHPSIILLKKSVYLFINYSNSLDAIFHPPRA